MTTASQRRNSAFVGGALKYGTLQDEFAAFDLLPPLLRDCLNEHAVKVAALSVLPHYGWAACQFGYKDGGDTTFLKLCQLEDSEIGVFAAMYRGRWRVPYPHVAAEASILRYGSIRARRRLPPLRRRGVSDWLTVPTAT